VRRCVVFTDAFIVFPMLDEFLVDTADEFERNGVKRIEWPETLGAAAVPSTQDGVASNVIVYDYANLWG